MGNFRELTNRAVGRGAVSAHRRTRELRFLRSVMMLTIGPVRVSTCSAAIAVAVWGTGNMGSTAIRSVTAFPGLRTDRCHHVVARTKPAGTPRPSPASTAPTGVVASTDVDAVLVALRRRRLHGLRRHPARGGDRRHRALPARGRARRHPVAVLALRPALGPAGMGGPAHRGRRARAEPRCWSAVSTRAGPTMRSRSPRPGCAPASTPSHCQEIFDYSTYDQPLRGAGLLRIRRPRWTRPR